jgi:hypothetical protein
MRRYPRSIEEFLAEPYCERQLVSFFNDGSSQERALADALGPGSSGPLFFQFPMTPYEFMASLIVGLIHYSRSHRGGVSVAFLPNRWAAALQLPPLHPRAKVLYAAHPVEPSTYIPIARFHRFAFEHKFSELLLILTRLGAKRITAYHVRGWGRELASSLPIPASELEIGGKVAAGTKRRQGDKILFEAKLAGGDCLELPEKLAWYRFEPTWQSLVEQRRRGLEKYSLLLHYDDDYGIKSNLKLYAERAGFEVSGNFQQHKATTWQIEVLF